MSRFVHLPKILTRTILADMTPAGLAKYDVTKEYTRMGWATLYIAKLKEGETVQFRPRGHSMSGRIESGQLCTVVPIIDPTELVAGDIVLCKVNGNQYIHLIKSVQGLRFQIGNNRGRINGWISANSIYGKCNRIEP